MQARPRGQGSGWLALAGYAGLGLACLLLALATFIFVAAPIDGVRDRLAQDIKARTGRDFVVAGPTSLSLLPRPAVSFADVSLSAAPGMGGEPILRAKTVQAEVGVLSLFSQQPAVRRLVVSRPVIELRVDAQGRRSWEFGALEDRRVRVAQAGGPGALPSRALRAPAAFDTAQLAAALEKLLPTSVRVVDGTVRYIDERAGMRHEIGSLELDLVANDIGGPLEAKGSFAWRGESVALQAALAPIRGLLEDQKARLTFKLSGRPVEANYDGALEVASGLALDGLLGIKAPSLRGLASWAGGGMGSGSQDPDAFSLSSAVAGADGRLSLSRLTASLGATSLDGALTIETKGARPHLGGNLHLSELDLARILVSPAPPSAADAMKGKSMPHTNTLDRLNCGPVKFSGGSDALYERHLTFDHVVPVAAATPRDKFEAVARSVRDAAVAAMDQDRADVSGAQRQARLLPVARIPDGPGAGEQHHEPDAGSASGASSARSTRSTRWRSSSRSPTPVSATAGSAGWRRASSIRWPRWAFRAWAPACATSTASSSRSMRDGWQREQPDHWLARPDPWEVARPDEAVEVRLACSFDIQAGALRTVRDGPRR